ncbi:GtrA family protein [Pseudomonas sp. C2B4]|uniref:GtrA family protein n=1 Tax=Pseudomonas sp. C2B4 TaxID=2735270 RepID=UPI00158607B6|nr:GtrA family protein [Pseudomonas sp. C2B4]NUU36837.1 GtrA family protein [Pseudomonas sp. C2B4]
MRALWNKFGGYMIVGALSTLLHWQIFFVLVTAFELSQTASNFAGFCIAASFSFYMNAVFTFDSKALLYRYLLFIGFMAVLNIAIGNVADALQWRGIVTVAVFSSLSLVGGFLFSMFFLFRERQT